MSLLGSVVFYFIVFGISAVIFNFGITRKFKLFVGLGLIIPILVSGLRYGVGTDYANYVETFYEINSYSFGDFIDKYQRLEVGFVGLNKLAYFITGTPTMMFLLGSALIILFFALGLKRYSVNHKALIYFVFLVTVLPITFNAVRQGIAMAIVFYAISFIISRQPLKFSFLIVVSSLFHATSLLLLPLYMLNVVIKKNKPELHYRIGIAITVIAGLFLLAMPTVLSAITGLEIFERYVVYLNSNQASSQYFIMIKVLLIGIFAIFYKRIIALNPANIYYFAFALLDLVISTIGFSSYELYRMTYYLSFFSIFLLVSLVDIFKVGIQRRLVILGVILYSILYFLYAYYSLGSNDILPYSWQV